jgi:Mg2+-importing ATPase
MVGASVPFWAMEDEPLAASLAAHSDGLSSSEAAARMTNARGVHSHHLDEWRLVVRQVENPIVLLLIGAAFLSMLLGDTVDSVIILAITMASALLGYVQERGAVRAVEALMATVGAQAAVRRDGQTVQVLLDDVVVGDLLLLRAGDVVAADARVLDAAGLLLDESALTGESFPRDKQPGVASASAPLAERENVVWCGTHVVSGTGTALVAAVGADTEFGQVGTNLAAAHVPTAFEQGLRRFGLLLMRATAVLVGGIFAVNVALDRPLFESLLFSLALAVGLTPQLLPTIVTVTLSYGARRMARRQVVVKRLDAIEDIGSIDVLCTDKTGTLTDGSIVLAVALDPAGAPAEHVRTLGWCNAAAQTGFVNPIDAALLAAAPAQVPEHRRIAEVPYDFVRRVLSVLVELDGTTLLITKGALVPVLDACTLDGASRDEVLHRFEQLSAEGLRVLGLATKPIGPATTTISPVDETGLEFAGFLCFTDPPKADAAAAIQQLADLGVATKLITGDNRFAAAHVAAAVGLDGTQLLTGAELAQLTADELDRRVDDIVVFAEIDPLHKEAIVKALRRGGHTVGYLGDGINDAPSLRSADVGISVDTAVDIARHTASIVLLDKSLSVIAEGITYGRRVFANTIKYVQVTISANFGNMLSMAVAAVVLPFLPLLPRQILLLNFLSDIPGMTIAADRVDPEQVARPHGWDTRRLRNFMLVYGTISSVFDLATFAVLRLGFDADAALFRTGWFIESTATELAVMLVLRTRRRAWQSRPALALVLVSLGVAAITVLVPYSPVGADLGFDHPTAGVLLALVGMTVSYVAATEVAKWLRRKESAFA